MRYDQIAARMFETPLLLDPAKASAIIGGLGHRLLGAQPVLLGFSDSAAREAGRAAPRASILGREIEGAGEARGDRLYAVRDGVAVIEVTGTLVHRGAWLGESSGVTSYEGLAQQIDAAVRDPEVAAIAIEVDSFGGEVAGVFDLADRIRAARRQKPVWAFVAEAALSAGYAIASQAERIVVPRTGEVGSIGVLLMHVDWSRALANEGVAVSLIHAGAHKVEGNPYEPLPAAVREKLEADVEALRALFASTVVAGRSGRVSLEAVLATEAAVYRGSDALAAGLADEVADLEEAFRRLAGARAAQRAGARATGTGRKELTMQDQTGPRMAVEDEARESEPDTVAVQDEADAAPGGEQPAARRLTLVGGDAGAAAVQAAAEVAEVCAQAGRLGVPLDAAALIREGASADAVRREVIDRLAARSAETGAIVAARAPAAAGTGTALLDAVKKRVAGA